MQWKEPESHTENFLFSNTSSENVHSNIEEFHQKNGINQKVILVLEEKEKEARIIMLRYRGANETEKSVGMPILSAQFFDSR